MQSVFRHRSLLLVLALILGLGLHLPAQADSTAQVVPVEGRRGTRFVFSAGGFQAGERINVWLNEPDGSPRAVDVQQLNRADANGYADWEWTAPLDIRPGDWQMVAQGAAGDQQQVINFRIVPISSEELDANVQPNEGRVGTRFRFMATGFAPGENIDVWLNDPQGEARGADVDSLGEADSFGRADWSWRPKEVVLYGQWQMVAQGRESGVEHRIDFRIRR
jgi:Fe2+ transport system protein FeoA